MENLYNKATSAVFCNNNIGDWFRTTLGVRQGCLLSPTLFNIFLEIIMTDALEEHRGTVSIGIRPITNLRFADYIDGLARNECELASLWEQLDKASSNFGMKLWFEARLRPRLHIARNRPLQIAKVAFSIFKRVL
ncbi:endonuclease-reverse transcriptase [Plakobranchus ocellatus]|uniref:Endonuclease-reverse transcriptase n=1 Tax=Plakobranchus ocellatus TaxID=259542 RepID=A0AAV4ADM4_9GAST|nr:endonuclease-reverse transcriptase [Plakobranchus ocellatus]